MLTYLTCPSVQNSFIDFRKEEPVSNFRPSRFLYRGRLTGNFFYLLQVVPGINTETKEITVANLDYIKFQ